MHLEDARIRQIKPSVVRRDYGIMRNRRAAGNIGAEITGVDTGDHLGDDTVAAVRQALLEHKVVFLRDQNLDYQARWPSPDGWAR